MSISIKQLQVVLSAPVGPLNDLRRQAIAEALSEGFAPQQAPVPNSLALVNQQTREAIIVTDNQIHYNTDGNDFAGERMENLLAKVREVLLLEDRFSLALQIIAFKDAENRSAAELTIETLAPLSASRLREHFEGLRGVGLRITYELNPYNCDFRVEPFFNDPAFIFLQLNAQSSAEQSLNRVSEDANEFVNHLRLDLEDVVNEMLDMNEEQA